ncbi:MAG: energy-coupled thiamine transporter ThiT [Firmicutes bacterium]|nr:energy-coupled thiamine transporter ThiT [Bacillota bacterium]
MRDKNLQVMVEVSLLVAAAVLLSFLKLYQMPQGGSVSLEMLPIFILSFRHGGKIGMLGGALLGVVKLLVSPYIIHPVQLVMDYPLPFMLLGVAGLGLFRRHRILGVSVGAFLRFLTHVVAGAVFFAQYAPEGTPALLYSVGYNASYMIPETILVAIVVLILSRRREILVPNYK